MIRHRPGFTVDFRILRSAGENGDDNADGSRYGLLQYINPKTKYFQRKSIILDVTSSVMTKQALHHIEVLMPKRADFQFLIIGGDTKTVNSSVLRFGGINMTVLSLINFNSAAMKNYLIELHPRAREPIYLPTNLTYEAALLIDGLNALVEVLKLLNDPLSTEAEKMSNENARNALAAAYKSTLSAPCLPNFLPLFTATTLVSKIRQTSFIGLTGNISFNENGFRDGYEFEIWGTKMKKSFEKLPPFMMEVKDEDGNIIEGKYEGFCVDLVDKLAELIKFKYKLKVVSDGQFGAYINGSWNGMVGELIQKKADIVVAPLTITSSRERVVDFSTPFMELGLSVMYQKIERPTPDVLSFMEPLSTEIWMCISFAYLGVSVVLFLVSRLSPSEWGLSVRKLKVQAPISATPATGSSICQSAHQTISEHLDGKSSVSSVRSSGPCGGILEKDAVLVQSTEEAPGEMHNPFSIFNSFWFALSTFVQQGGDVVPRSLPGRIVGGAWWFFTLIIISSYTANLAAYLTVERMTSPIESYEDLARQTKVKYGVIKSGSSKEFFEKSNMKIFQKMWKFMESNPEVLVDSVNDGVNRVRQSNRDYAFLLESTMNEYFNQRQPCNTVKVGPNLESGKGYGVATPPGSDLRDQLNLAVLQLKEMDWIASLYRFWWEERGECGKLSKSTDGSLTTNSLGLDNVYGLFYLLAGALITGIVLSVFEFIYRCAVDAKRAKRGFGDVFCEMIHNATTDRARLTIPIRFQPSQPPSKPTSQSEMLLKGRSEEQVSKVDYCL
uniref:Glutamate receptor 2 n=2 Tax=Schistocephalus solidus TaxID=70667 RepID=A0A0X3PEX0_SCHSO